MKLNNIVNESITDTYKELSNDWLAVALLNCVVIIILICYANIRQLLTL